MSHKRNITKNSFLKFSILIFLLSVSYDTSFSLSSVWIAKSRPAVGFGNPTGAAWG
jgi:hypothetical protein